MIRISETLENLLPLERAVGRAQHVSIGRSMFDGGVDAPCFFSCNADRGLTWPEEHSTFKTNTSFEYPQVPTKEDGATTDWRQYPREAENSDLLTLRINPADKFGWFVAEKTIDGDGSYKLRCWWDAALSFMRTKQYEYCFFINLKNVNCGPRLCCVGISMGAVKFPLVNDLGRK